MSKLFYGCPINWNDMCNLVHKYVELNPKCLDHQKVQLDLIDLNSRDTRCQIEPICSHNDRIEDHLKKLGETANEHCKKILFTIFDPSCDEKFKKEGFEHFDYYCDLLSHLFINVDRHGCCDAGTPNDEPFVIGKKCYVESKKLDTYKDIISSTVILPSKERCDKVEVFFSVFIPEKRAKYMVIRTQCRDCTTTYQ
jgi:hypothetical protein